MDEIEKYIAIKDKLLEAIKKEFKIQRILIVILAIVALIICFRSIKLEKSYEKLQEEKQELEATIETKDSMIADLEENCKKLGIEIENLKGEN